ncbi:FadR/GntR family transcriptional regulator [Acrocarpospora catenulata]|uniref:FadR/GntR family transcriptional regulator n=1 Tax=Acrocarpospora catenulata TaxID=2836182 RepID=UPI001BD91F94|nr:FadR/GntR family transcriptional regulator [Acrocarpospora catenulata]
MDVQASKVIGTKVLRPRQQVEETLRALILSGELKSGEMLPPETELARQFNVSRTTLREALRTLVSERLLVKVPGAHGGNIVQSVTSNALGGVVMDAMENLLAIGSIDFDEVAHVRRYLEIPSARLAAVSRTEEDLAELKEIVATQKSISVDDPRVPDLDARFHTGIARATGNRVLTSLVQALHRATEPVHYLDLSPEVGRDTVRQHQAIVAALEAKDPAGAEQAIVEHLDYLREHITAHRGR